MKKKYGFTLAEMLIFLGIAGVLIAVGLTTFSHFDKGIRYIYSNTYHVLDRALYNAVNFSNLDDAFETQSVGELGELVDVTEEQGRQRLCLMLTDYINTLEVNCNAASVDDMGNEFGTPHFIAANGVKFYISNRMRASDEEPIFYLIYGDINGDKGPNSMNYEPASAANNFRTIDPDIFAFAALDIGRVCPLGPPEVDPRYMQTRITYNATENKIVDGVASTEVVTKYTKTSKPYFISKAEAWGYYLTSADALPEATIIDNTPYSYNGYIKNTISPDSMIYSFLGGANIVAPASVRLRAEPVIEGGLGCKRQSDDDCSIIVDRYIY